MTEFKQIVGRGTRIREDYRKLYFTIMDFKGATRLFLDPEFDGEPVTIYEPKEGETVVPPDDISGDGVDEMIDVETVRVCDVTDTGETIIKKPQIRYELENVQVGAGVERMQYLDENGKLITEELRVHLKEEIKRCLLGQFASMQDFLKRWTESERKQVILDELNEFGIDLQILSNAVPKAEELDAFDLIAHIAWDQKPLTRRERANNVKKRNYFAKYGEQARAVLEALLEKYADHGITDIEDATILELPPFDEFGGKRIIRYDIFGGPDEFSKALTELEQELYSAQAA
jgi:type I restriction enzyme R subunit